MDLHLQPDWQRALGVTGRGLERREKGLGRNGGGRHAGRFASLDFSGRKITETNDFPSRRISGFHAFPAGVVRERPLEPGGEFLPAAAFVRDLV